MKTVLPLVLTLLLLLPLAAPPAAADATPLAVAAVSTPEGVQVTWVADADPTLESFRVYGKTSAGAIHLLRSLPSLHRASLEPAGYAQYGVAGVNAAGQSAIVWATPAP